MTAREQKDRGGETTPSRMAETTPPTPTPDYSVHMMQSILEMQRTLGGVEHAVTTLETTAKEQGEKLDKISHRVYAAAAIITVLLGIGAFLLNKIADALIIKLTH